MWPTEKLPNYIQVEGLCIRKSVLDIGGHSAGYSCCRTARLTPSLNEAMHNVDGTISALYCGFILKIWNGACCQLESMGLSPVCQCSTCSPKAIQETPAFHKNVAPVVLLLTPLAISTACGVCISNCNLVKCYKQTKSFHHDWRQGDEIGFYIEPATSDSSHLTVTVIINGLAIGSITNVVSDPRVPLYPTFSLCDKNNIWEHVHTPKIPTFLL